MFVLCYMSHFRSFSFSAKMVTGLSAGHTFDSEVEDNNLLGTVHIHLTGVTFFSDLNLGLVISWCYLILMFSVHFLLLMIFWNTVITAHLSGNEMKPSPLPLRSYLFSQSFIFLINLL